MNTATNIFWSLICIALCSAAIYLLYSPPPEAPDPDALPALNDTTNDHTMFLSKNTDAIIYADTTDHLPIITVMPDGRVIYMNERNIDSCEDILRREAGLVQHADGSWSSPFTP